MGRASWLAVAVCGLAALGAVRMDAHGGLLTPVAWSQNIGVRTVRGTVLDDSAKPTANATVFLKNQKTKAIRSYSSTADGHFYFAQIDMSVDYDLWAPSRPLALGMRAKSLSRN
jgi:hypothetical protein